MPWNFSATPRWCGRGRPGGRGSPSSAPRGGRPGAGRPVGDLAGGGVGPAGLHGGRRVPPVRTAGAVPAAAVPVPGGGRARRGRRSGRTGAAAGLLGDPRPAQQLPRQPVPRAVRPAPVHAGRADPAQTVDRGRAVRPRGQQPSAPALRGPPGRPQPDRALDGHPSAGDARGDGSGGHREDRAARPSRAHLAARLAGGPGSRSRPGDTPPHGHRPRGAELPGAVRPLARRPAARGPVGDRRGAGAAGGAGDLGAVHGGLRAVGQAGGVGEPPLRRTRRGPPRPGARDRPARPRPALAHARRPGDRRHPGPAAPAHHRARGGGVAAGRAGAQRRAPGPGDDAEARASIAGMVRSVLDTDGSPTGARHTRRTGSGRRRSSRGAVTARSWWPAWSRPASPAAPPSSRRRSCWPGCATAAPTCGPASRRRRPISPGSPARGGPTRCCGRSRWPRAPCRPRTRPG